MTNIGKNIKHLRMMKNLTQDQLAEQLFVSRQTVSNYENNKSNPDIDMLVKIAEVLGTDVNTLIYGSPETSIKRKQILRDIILAVIILLLGLTVARGNEFFVDIREHYYDPFPLVDYTLLIKTPYVFLTGWYCMELFLLFFKVQPIKPEITKRIRIVILVIVIVYVAAISPWIIWQGLYWINYAIHGHDYGNTYYGSLSYGKYGFAWAYSISIWYSGWYFLAAIPGIMWRISKCNKKEMKEKNYLKTGKTGKD